MLKCKSQITIFFDAPFWVGVYQRMNGPKLEVCKITFGAEPKDYEVYDYLLQHWATLPFGKPISAAVKPDVKMNPKRMQRTIKRQLESSGIGTKAQQAIKLQQAKGKAARKRKSRLVREQEKERHFALKQNKKKQKHKGH